jgi:hypothetical protein
MSRKSDVFESLEYSGHVLNELSEKIFSGAFDNTPVKHLSTMAGSILAGTREVFDFCAKDIVETYIAPNDTSIAEKVTKNILKCYYPLYKNQLTGATLFGRLKNINRPLHERLFSIAAAIENKRARLGVFLNYGNLKDLADMVNQNKHDKLLKVHSDDKTIFSAHPGLKVMLPIAEQRGMSLSTICLSPNAIHVIGDNYVFEYNGRDVTTFCAECGALARLLMEELYSKYLS